MDLYSNLNETYKQEVNHFIEKLIKRAHRKKPIKMMEATIDPNMENKELYNALLNNKTIKRKYFVFDGIRYKLTYTDEALKVIAEIQAQRNKNTLKNYFEKNKEKHKQYCKNKMRQKYLKIKLEKMLTNKLNIINQIN